jgi:hypothetical protein
MDMIGKMYHVLTVLVNNPTTLGAGAQDSYTNLLETRCSLKKSGGGRGLSFGEVAGNESSQIVTRYQDAIWNAIDMSMKFMIDGVTYTLAAPAEKIQDKRKDYIKFTVNSETSG